MQKSAKWYAQWFKDPGFKADTLKQWNQLKADGVFTTWINSIAAEAATLEQSQANNFARWPMLGERVWPNPLAVGSYDGEVSYLTNWLSLRVAYLDSVLNGKTSTKTTLSVPGGTLRTGAPVLLKSATTTTGMGTPTGTVTFMSNGLVVGTAPLDGTGTASGSYNFPAGKDSLTAVYSGDSVFGLSASAAHSVTVLAPLVETATSISASAYQVSQGTAVSFPVSVLATSGTTSPTGSATIQVNGKSFGNVTLSGGSGQLTSTVLPLGTNTIQAFYGGDQNFSSSSSPVTTVAVSAPQGCSAPSAADVNVCSPPKNSTVGSPVQVQATAKITGTLARMEVWVDGVKKYTETSGQHLSTSLALAAGKHRFDVYAVNTKGTKWEATVYATVK